MYVYLCSFTGSVVGPLISLVLSPLPEFPRKLRQSKNKRHACLVMGTPSGGEDCEELKRTLPREPYVQRHGSGKLQAVSWKLERMGLAT